MFSDTISLYFISRIKHRWISSASLADAVNSPRHRSKQSLCNRTASCICLRQLVVSLTFVWSRNFKLPAIWRVKMPYKPSQYVLPEVLIKQFARTNWVFNSTTDCVLHTVTDHHTPRQTGAINPIQISLLCSMPCQNLLAPLVIVASDLVLGIT